MKTRAQKLELSEIVGKPIAFPEYDSFLDLFQLLGEETVSREVEPGSKIRTWMSKRGQGKYGSLYVLPCRKVIDYLKEQNVVELELYFSAVDRGDNETLIIAQYDQIIGSRWLAIVRTDTVPEARS